MAAKILVVDDEAKIVEMISQYLRAEGYEVVKAEDGPSALAAVGRECPDLVLLDWMLPGKSGLDVCREIRAASRIPIIMLTARVEEGDKVLGLEMGADDYITKPFGMRELVARIRSVLRRYEVQSDLAREKDAVLVRGALTIDQEKFEAWLEGQPLNLTLTEFKILQTLAQRPGVVYSRLQLMRIAMGEAYVNYERSIDTHVSNLRKKLGESQGETRYILTVFGAGYKFAERY